MALVKQPGEYEEREKQHRLLSIKSMASIIHAAGVKAGIAHFNRDEARTRTAMYQVVDTLPKGSPLYKKIVGINTTYQLAECLVVAVAQQMIANRLASGRPNYNTVPPEKAERMYEYLAEKYDPTC